MQTRDQELSFGTKIYDILFDIDEDISPRRKKRKVIWATLYILNIQWKHMQQISLLSTKKSNQSKHM